MKNMQRLFKVVVFAVLALVIASCKPSIVGEWQFVKAECYEEGELLEVDEDSDYWSLMFFEDGTGWEREYDEESSFYWICDDDRLYMDEFPLNQLDNVGWFDVKSLKENELQLMWKELDYDYMEVYIFKKIK